MSARPLFFSAPTPVRQGAWLGWRYAAATHGKDSDCSHPNDDAWLVRCAPAHLSIGTLDVATQKRGINGIEIQAAIVEAFAGSSLNASPAEIISAAHARLAAELARRQARGVSCLMIVQLNNDGYCTWAHVGDAALLLYRPISLWRRSRLKLLNTRHRLGHGLTQSVGIASPRGPRIEEGGFKTSTGDRLLLATDGVFHDSMRLPMLKRWLDEHHRQRHLLLPADLVRKIETEARFTQPQPDDSTLVIVERTTR